MSAAGGGVHREGDNSVCVCGGGSGLISKNCHSYHKYKPTKQFLRIAYLETNSSSSRDLALRCRRARGPCPFLSMVAVKFSTYR